MHDFRRLEVWHEAIDVAAAVYIRARGLPAWERFGLASQMRSAAVSVSSNIAEAAGRGGKADMKRILRIALGSLAEVDSQLELAVRLGYLEDDPDLTRRIKTLGGRIRRLHNQMDG